MLGSVDLIHMVLCLFAFWLGLSNRRETVNMGKQKGHSHYSSSPSFWDVALGSVAFGLVGFHLALSAVTYFLWSHFLFDGSACVPVLPVVWPEVSNNGVCRLLGPARGKSRGNELSECTDIYT